MTYEERLRKEIEIREAVLNGETVEVLAGGIWRVIDCPGFYDSIENYRVKPKPRKFLIGLDENGGPNGKVLLVDDKPAVWGGRYVRAQEILED